VINPVDNEKGNFMSKKWQCPECSCLNSLFSRYCSNCSHSIVDLKKHMVDAEDSEDPDDAFSIIMTDAGSDDNPEFIPVPREGDLISPLLEVTDNLLAGQVTRDTFSEFLDTVYGNLDGIFEEILNDLSSVFDEDEDNNDEETDIFSESIQDGIKFVRYLFRRSLEEMTLYLEDRDHYHILFGQKLARKAEQEYINIIKDLKATATFNPFAGESDVVSNLASQVAIGKMDISIYNEQLDALEDFINETLRKTSSILKDAFDKARLFNGADEEKILEATEELKKAADNLGKVILNLYSPEDIRRSVQEIIESVVDNMEEDKAKHTQDLSEEITEETVD
jgi:hypothetical protein